MRTNIMRTPKTCHAGALAVAVLLGACASNLPSDVANLPGKEACFWTSTIFNWTALDDSTLIVDAPTEQAPYLVKLMAPIPGLRASDRVGFLGGDPTGMFCKMSSVFIRGSLSYREPVVAVRALTPAQAKEMLARDNAPGVSHQPGRDESATTETQPAPER